MSLCIYHYKFQITDYLLCQYAKCNKIKRTNDYRVTHCRVVDKNNKIVKESCDLIDYITAVNLCKNKLGHVIISYQLLGKRFKIMYDCKYKFPPYPNMLKLKEGYKYKFLSAISNDKDITDDVNQLLGPKNNFYNDIGLKMKSKYISTCRIDCMDNNVDDFIMGDNFNTYESNEIHLD